MDAKLRATPVAAIVLGTAAALAAAAARAGAEPSGTPPALLEVRVVARAPGSALPSDAALHARVEEKVELAAVARVRVPGKKPRWVGPPGLTAARVRGKKIALGGWDTAAFGPEPAVRWHKVEPLMRHVDEPGRVAGFRGYCNAMLGGPDHGKWLGIDKITYIENVLEGGGWTRPADAHPTDHELDVHGGLGTMRFKAALSVDGGASWVESPGAASIDRHGILGDVTRVSFRESDDYAGWLTSLFNVPEVFGSVEAQAERFVGADCADVIIAAARARGHRSLRYTYVAGLWKYAAPASEEIALEADGRLSAAGLRWGTDVHRGDVVPIRYRLPSEAYGGRSWPHVGVLYGDASAPDGPHRGGPDGIFDGHDLILHMGHPELTIEPLRSQGPATIVVLRWKKGTVR